MKNKKNKHKDLVLYVVKRGNIEKMFQFLQQVANYNVDIAVALKGAKQLTSFNREVKATTTNIDAFAKQLRSAAKDQGLLVKSFDNLNQVKINGLSYDDKIVGDNMHKLFDGPVRKVYNPYIEKIPKSIKERYEHIKI